MEWFGNSTITFVVDMWHLDTDFSRWLLWLFTPVLMAFFLPILILVFLYLCVLFLYIYRHTYDLKGVNAGLDVWDKARLVIATFWDAHGYIWHGYEVSGMENIPREGPALLVYYHGTLPIDYYYLLAKCILYKNRKVQAVGDRFLFQIPGWYLLMELFNVQPGTVHTCAQVLGEGNLLSVAPGGVMEALFGDENYNLVWGKRIGFAKVALQGKAPIVPIFTENLRESFRTPWVFRALCRGLYNWTRLPLVPIYGGFPVKMTTHIGEPIPYDSNMTAEELATKTADAIRKLIREHQKVPGSVLRGLVERVLPTTAEKDKHL